MKPVRIPGVLPYAAAAMWLLQVMLQPARAADAAPSAALDAPVAARSIARGETIREGDFTWIAAPTGASALAPAGDPAGMTARRPLEPGAVIRAADVSSPTLVKRGQMTTLIAEAPGVRVTQMALAMKSGAKGDIVEFRNVNSERVVKAVVIGENLALAQQRPGL